MRVSQISHSVKITLDLEISLKLFFILSKKLTVRNNTKKQKNIIKFVKRILGGKF